MSAAFAACRREWIFGMSISNATSNTFDPLMRFPAYRGQPDGTSEQTPADVGGDGGGDIDLAVGFPPIGRTRRKPRSRFSPTAVSPWPTSPPATRVMRGVNFNLNPVGNLTGGPPGDDRQWHEFLGSNSVYLLYRTVAPAIAQIQRSNDGGFTYGPSASAGLIGQVGCLDVHQATGVVYATGNNGVIAVGTPSVPGQAPTAADYTIRTAATDPNGVAHIFFVGKVADDGTPNGTLYALYSNDSHIYLKHSTDKAATWSAPVQVDPPTGPYATQRERLPLDGNRSHARLRRHRLVRDDRERERRQRAVESLFRAKLQRQQQHARLPDRRESPRPSITFTARTFPRWASTPPAAAIAT